MSSSVDAGAKEMKDIVEKAKKLIMELYDETVSKVSGVKAVVKKLVVNFTTMKFGGGKAYEMLEPVVCALEEMAKSLEGIVHTVPPEVEMEYSPTTHAATFKIVVWCKIQAKWKNEM